MKTIDVRIRCSDQYQVFVHDVILALEKDYPATAQIFVTELPPPQGDCKACLKKLAADIVEYLSEQDNRDVFHTEAFIRNWQPATPVQSKQVEATCENCGHNRTTQYCQRRNVCGNWQPAAPVAPAVSVKDDKYKLDEFGNITHNGGAIMLEKPMAPAVERKITAPNIPAKRPALPSKCHIIGCKDYDKDGNFCLHIGACPHTMFDAPPCPSCEKLRGELERLQAVVGQADYESIESVLNQAKGEG